MLLEFSVENFMSFKKISIFSMISSSGRELPSHVVTWGKSKKPELSVNRVGALFGANASGKSNFIAAFHAMTDLVTRFGLRLPDAKRKQRPAKQLPYKPYKFVGGGGSLPSSFQALFISGDKIYRYGFSQTQEAFTREWLYVRGGANKAEKRVFLRTGNEVQCGEELAPYTRHAADKNLFLTVLAELNVGEYARVISFFQNVSLREGYAFDMGDVLAASDKEDFSIVCDVLAFVDTGLSGIVKKDMEALETDMAELAELPEKAKKFLEALVDLVEPVKNKTAYQILFQHDVFDDAGVSPRRFTLGPHEESRGTIVFIGIIANIVAALKNNSIIIIDELDSSLHPLVVEGIVKLFANTKNSTAQLIFTSHCPFIFDKDKIRRDELWIVEKDTYGESAIFSAASFNARSDGNLAKQYMEGRFGGVPAIQYAHLEKCSERISALIAGNA